MVIQNQLLIKKNIISRLLGNYVSHNFTIHVDKKHNCYVYGTIRDIDKSLLVP